MDTSEHSVLGLFSQLGLGETQKDVDQFIAQNGGLSASVRLSEADFFTSSQQAFLAQEWTNDSEWVSAIDELDALLRS